jgi:hypothetical protein
MLKKETYYAQACYNFTSSLSSSTNGSSLKPTQKEDIVMVEKSILSELVGTHLKVTCLEPRGECKQGFCKAAISSQGDGGFTLIIGIPDSLGLFTLKNSDIEKVEGTGLIVAVLDENGEIQQMRLEPWPSSGAELVKKGGAP